ncbi:nucleoside-specific channel-forming protein Tsx [Pseudomonas sp. RIT-To-2]|uniref:nucleoside-specific channel-forming protein Tsx n=1 Tax=Pseudomonas sp. RIT-To-2 TaxID=3462541 RepID=UPI002413347D
MVCLSQRILPRLLPVAGLTLAVSLPGWAATGPSVGANPLPLDTTAPPSAASADGAPSSDTPWFNQDLTLIGSKDISFGPRPSDDIYLEYEYYGRKGPYELYGYIDAPKVLGIGNSHDSGEWDKGSPVFMEHEPRISIDELTGHTLAFGPFKEFYLAFDWIYDMGHTKADRANTLYSGFGTDIKTGTPVILSANLYARRQWENYGAANENSWDGYRAQLKYILPLKHFDNGASLTYIGFTNHDFGSDLHDQAGPSRTANATVATNVILYNYKHVRLMTAGRYFHNGGQWKDGTELNFGDGNFNARSTGWGYYFGIGYQF